MASYYDEHDCEPLQEGQQPNHLLHIARLLIDGGFGTALNMDFESMLGGEHRPVPAGKSAVANLKTETLSSQQTVPSGRCPVCLAEYEQGNILKTIPCGHKFHDSCILPWLNKTNSCPVCRYELPTDDPDYEEYRKQKARAKQRQYELETLHDSMFG